MQPQPGGVLPQPMTLPFQQGVLRKVTLWQLHNVTAPSITYMIDSADSILFLNIMYIVTTNYNSQLVMYCMHYFWL